MPECIYIMFLLKYNLFTSFWLCCTILRVVIVVNVCACAIVDAFAYCLAYFVNFTALTYYVIYLKETQAFDC